MDMKNYIIAVKYRIVWSESAKLLSWKQISIVFFCILCGIQLISTLYIIFLYFHNSNDAWIRRTSIDFRFKLHRWFAFQYTEIISAYKFAKERTVTSKI